MNSRPAQSPSVVRHKSPYEKTFYITCSFFSWSCNNQDNSSFKHNYSESVKKYSVRPLEIDSSEGWADVRLAVTEVSESKDGTLMRATSLYEGQELGLSVFIPSMPTDEKGFGNGFILKSTGDESDRLLRLLSKLYLQNDSNSIQFRDSLIVAYVDLDKFAKNVAGASQKDSTSIKKYKLFFEGAKEDEYAEIFLNYNMAEQRIELNEKDEEYRPILIKFLTK
jgi:hypothetical protein